MADTEVGLKWWVKNAIMPLIGSGGVVAILVVVLPVVMAQNVAKPAAAEAASAPVVAGPRSDTAPASSASLDDQARTAAAHAVHAMRTEDYAALVDMVDEPVQIAGQVHLTKLSLRCALEADRGKPSVAGVERLVGQDVQVRRLAAADLGTFPGAREGDYAALVPAVGSKGTAGSLQLHLRPRAAKFVVLRIVQGST